MSTNKTTNLGLHSWVRSDPFRMQEFNENFDKIDQTVGENSAALKKKAESSALSSAQSTLQSAIEQKADKTALSALEKTVALKADKTVTDALEKTVALKADKTVTDELEKTVALKADKTVTDELEKTVATKADKTALTALENTVATKADKSALTALENTVTTKADKTSLTSAQTTLQNALTALTGRVGALETDRLVYKLDSYKGTGDYKTTSNRLDFDFKPLLLFINSSNNAYGGYPWIRGQASGYSYTNSTNNLTWEAKAVSWYSNYNAMEQLNTKDNTYYYFALGVRE